MGCGRALRGSGKPSTLGGSFGVVAGASGSPRVAVFCHGPPNSAILPGGNLGGILRGPPFHLSGGAEWQRRKSSHLLGRFVTYPGKR